MLQQTLEWESPGSWLSVLGYKEMGGLLWKRRIYGAFVAAGERHQWVWNKSSSKPVCLLVLEVILSYLQHGSLLLERSLGHKQRKTALGEASATAKVPFCSWRNDVCAAESSRAQIHPGCPQMICQAWEGQDQVWFTSLTNIKSSQQRPGAGWSTWTDRATACSLEALPKPWGGSALCLLWYQSMEQTGTSCSFLLACLGFLVMYRGHWRDCCGPALSYSVQSVLSSQWLDLAKPTGPVKRPFHQDGWFLAHLPQKSSCYS